MADQKDNVVLVLLREIRAVQDDQGSRLRTIETRIDEIHESMVTSLGLAAHANVRHETVDKRLTDLTERVERLEKSS